MSRYRRVEIEGGTFFFTLTLADRSSDLLVRYIVRLRRIYGVRVNERVGTARKCAPLPTLRSLKQWYPCFHRAEQNPL